MRITQVRTMALKGTDPHGMGGVPRTWNVLLVRVDTDEGIYGLGEVPHWQRGYFGVRETVDYVGSRLIGKSPFDIKKNIHEHFFGAIPPHKPRTLPATVLTAGPIVWAMSGIEMCLHDIIGKKLHTPVYTLLGGKFRDSVNVYLDRSSPANKEDLSEWTDFAQTCLESGFTDIKFDIDHVAPDKTLDVWNRNIDRKQMRHIIERLTSVRETVGWDMNISVDCHMCYDIPTAIALGRELAPLRLKWLEDPTPLLNVDAARAVRDKIDVPLCLGEMFNADQFRQHMVHEAIDVAHPDVIFSGGLYETLKIAEMASSFNIPYALHNNSSSVGVLAGAHVAAATPNFIGLEYHFYDAQWIGALAARPNGKPLIESGKIELTDDSGLGFVLNEDVCRAHLSEGEVYFD